MESPRIKSVNSFSFQLVVLTVGAIALLFFSQSLIREGTAGRYPQFWPLLIAAGLGVVGLLCLRAILRLDTLLIYNDRLEIISILGYLKKTIYLGDITGWTEELMKDKQRTWYKLTVSTDLTRYRLSSNNYLNYDELKEALIQKAPRDIDKEKELARRDSIYYGMLGLLGASLFFGSAYYVGNGKGSPLTSNDLRQFNGVLLNEPKIITGSKGAHYIHLYLKPFSYFTFKIDGPAYSVMKTSDFLDYARVGDTLTVTVSKTDYEMKLTNEKAPTFWVRSVNFSTVSVYGLSKEKQQYLVFYEFRQKNADNGAAVALLALLGFFCLMVSAFSFKTAFKVAT